MEDRMKKKTMSVNLNKNKPLIVLFLIIAIMTVASPVFLTPGNLLTVLLQTSYNAILAVGISLPFSSAALTFRLAPFLLSAVLSVRCS